jgi:CheY-like chemotaxis protein
MAGYVEYLAACALHDRQGSPLLFPYEPVHRVTHESGALTRAAGPHEPTRVETMVMPPKILIVEDNATTRIGLEELLRGAGYLTLVASTFLEGRRALERDTPDLLITDLRLEGFNGLQLVHVNPRPIPAIIITGFPDEVLMNDARRLGAEYMVKPFEPSALLATIARTLALARNARVDERRRSTRRRITADLPVEANAMPARILDLSEQGMRLEIQRPLVVALPPSLRLVFPVYALTVDVDVVWSAKDASGRWQCGASVGADANPDWARLLAVNA